MALICVICCVICILYKRKCIKRRSLARTNRATSNNFYPPSLATSHGIPIPVTVDESCTAEAHEMQQLMSDEGSTHIPPVMPTHLDTKVSLFIYLSIIRSTKQCINSLIQCNTL